MYVHVMAESMAKILLEIKAVVRIWIGHLFLNPALLTAGVVLGSPELRPSKDNNCVICHIRSCTDVT